MVVTGGVFCSEEIGPTSDLIVSGEVKCLNILNERPTINSK
jgi:hypothetical protein